MASAQEIRFGTDGWRAVIGREFTFGNVRRIADAAGRVFSSDSSGGVVLVGYDTRFQADAFAAVTAEVLAAHGLDVRLSDRMLPTPALSFAADRGPAIGAVMLTASHNPSEYLGFKLKMADGGSAPPSFTARVEEALPEDVSGESAEYATVDLVTDYIAALKGLVDGDAIAAGGLKVGVDPLFGAGQGYLAGVLRELGVEVHELHSESNPGFGGLHPEPIPPHVGALQHLVPDEGLDGGFATDGDADRIGAVDEHGAFVNPHRIFGLVLLHLVRDKGMTGAVVKTVSTSVLLDRLCAHLGLECRTTPVGFKYIYEHMAAGGVLIGGEESGGIGIPSHVKERDGLANALLLAEMMVKRGKGLAGLVEELFEITGPVEYHRLDLKLDPAVKDAFVASMPTLDRCVAATQAFGH